MDIKDYSDNYSDHYSSEFKFEPVLVKYRRKKVLDAVNKYPHKDILEIGCGMEPFFKFLNDFDKFVIAEPAGPFVDNAKKLANDDNRISVFQGFFEDLVDNIKIKGPYDFIIFSSLIHEVNNPEDFMLKIHSLCGTNTVVHLNVPNMYAFHRLLALEMGLINDIHDRSGLDKRFQRTGNFDIKSLSELINKTGFDIIDKGTYFIKTLTNGQYEQLIKLGIADEKIFDGLDKMIKYIPELGAEMFMNVRIKS